MNNEVCKKFQDLRNSLSDELDGNGIPEFKDDSFLNKYCYFGKCNSDFDRINAGCLYLLDAFFKDSSVFESIAKKNINVVEYILIWLSYMLNLNKTKGHESIKSFYNYQIDSCDKYKTRINKFTTYESYKGLIDTKKDLLYMDSNILKKFVEKYKELNEDSDINKKSPYDQLLSTLSTDYNKLKNECKDDKDSNFPTLLGIDTSQDTTESIEKTGEAGKTGQKSDFTSSSSSIASKLIPVLSIIVAVAIFLGISYKYSLCEFRKRAQKHLREKLKK
ncbi:PIR protein [Plasmodium yoelii yoelii]|uniref:PIR protein n=1 Tax=Plasmodium yoelii yoelii TaxID=73239 RepID=A0AAF0B4Z8_PLAYO|nr:PIR protein [Plasmodium yoelii yoelii]